MKKEILITLLSVVCLGLGILTAEEGAPQMAFIGAIISAVAGIGSAVAGGIMSSNAQAKKERLEKEKADMARRYIERQAKEEDEDYAAHINERAMYKYAAQYNANRLSDALREQLKDTRGRQAVMGGTDEMVAEQMNKQARAMGDYYGQVEQQDEVEKKQLEREHKARKRELEAKALGVQDQYYTQQAENAALRGQNIASAVSSGINAVGQVAGSLSDANLRRTNTRTAAQGVAAPTQPHIGFENIRVDIPQRNDADNPWSMMAADYYNVGGSKGLLNIDSKNEYFLKKNPNS